nr:MAG TPA: hypothetical protein [Caudoviricetes sp.]
MIRLTKSFLPFIPTNSSSRIIAPRQVATLTNPNHRRGGERLYIKLVREYCLKTASIFTYQKRGYKSKIYIMNLLKDCLLSSQTERAYYYINRHFG